MMTLIVALVLKKVVFHGIVAEVSLNVHISEFSLCSHTRTTLLPARTVSALTDMSLFWGFAVLCYCSRAHGIKFHTRGGQGAASSSNQQDGHPHGLRVLTDSMVAKYYAYTVARNTISIRQG